MDNYFQPLVTGYYQITPPITAAAGDTLWIPIHYQSTGATMAWREPWTWTGATSNTVTTTYNTGVPPVSEEARRQGTIERYIDSGQELPANYQALMTEEQRVRYDRSRANWLQMERERQQRRLVASTKAYALLDLLLTEEQRRELAQDARITVDSPAGNRYVLHKGVRSGNVSCWNPEVQRITASLCVHLHGRYPDGDNLAAQLLAIHDDETAFLRTANVTGQLPAGMILARGGQPPPRVNPLAPEERAARRERALAA